MGYIVIEKRRIFSNILFLVHRRLRADTYEPQQKMSTVGASQAINSLQLFGRKNESERSTGYARKISRVFIFTMPKNHDTGLVQPHFGVYRLPAVRRV